MQSVIDTTKQLFTMKEFAELLGIDYRKVWRWSNKALLPMYQRKHLKLYSGDQVIAACYLLGLEYCDVHTKIADVMEKMKKEVTN